MQRTVAAVGPLATAAANNIAPSQTPLTGTLSLTGTPTSGSNAKASQVTASISGNVMTVTATASGGMTPGQRLSGAGVTANTIVQNYGVTAGTFIVFPAQTVTSTTIYGNQVVTLDQPRQVLITTGANESAKTITIVGTDWAGTLITETVTGPSTSTAATAQSFLTVTQAYISANATGALTLGTNTVASTPWVRLDGWASGQVAIQASVSGTANYTIQSSMDDPNGVVNITSPANMTWVNSDDLGVVGANTTQATTLTAAPLWVRGVLNSGNGTVTVTVQQAGSVAY